MKPQRDPSGCGNSRGSGCVNCRYQSELQWPSVRLAGKLWGAQMWVWRSRWMWQLWPDGRPLEVLHLRLARPPQVGLPPTD